MYHYFLGITLLKMVNPYFRKHLLNTIDTHDLLFMNGFIMAILISIIFLYQIIVNKTLNKTIINYNKLTYTQVGCLVILCSMGIASSLLLFELDKNHNTPFLNHIFLKSGGILLLLFISIIIFEEEYNIYQICGIALALLGLIILSVN
jgi:uncharacterized membrane protein